MSCNRSPQGFYVAPTVFDEWYTLNNPLAWLGECPESSVVARFFYNHTEEILLFKSGTVKAFAIETLLRHGVRPP